MTNGIAKSIRRGLEEAIAFVEDTADPSLFNVHASEKEGRQGIRRKTSLVKFGGRAEVR